MKKIRCTDMKVGGIFGLAFYSDRSAILTGTVLSMPKVPVNAMTSKDRFILDVEGEKIEFFRNACPPHYLESKRPSVRGVRNTRVIFYDIGKGDIAEQKEEYLPISVISLQTTKPKVQKVRGHAITNLPDVIILPAPIVETNVSISVSTDKPTRNEGENFGQFMKRLSAWKKSQVSEG